MTAESTFLDSGRAALADGRWADAASAFEDALRSGEDPGAIFGLGIAHWWLGENATAMRRWQQAFVAYRRQGQIPNAVMAAFYLCLAYQMTYGNTRAARGWLGRAARAADSPGGEGSEGWVALARAHLSIDDGRPGDAERWAREATAAAVAAGDIDLELCAASELGAALIEEGRIGEGKALLDDAMAGAVGGEPRDRDAVVLISCRTIAALSRAGDLRGVIQWVTVADAFHRQYGSPHLYATCRAQYGAILFAVGRWADAERELDHAIRISADAEANVRAEAVATLAEVRLAQGRPDEAARVLAGHEANPAATVALARLHLSAGRARAARSLLRRRLRRHGTQALAATTLQDLLVEAELQSGDVGAAAEVAAVMLATATTTEASVAAARAQRAAGRVALSRGDSAGASASLVLAVEAFEEADLPLDAARTRLLLAQALAEFDSETAAADARLALATLDRLGAAREADAAVAQLRSMGVRAARSAPAATGVLTRRELEVLALLAEGLSNRAIGDRLFITPKTAEHHVASVLAKTGLTRRSEAAAYAFRQLSGGSAQK